MKHATRTVIFVGLALMQSGVAWPVDPLGLLTATTLAGNNPDTFQPWKAGDTYRLVFITSGKRTAYSTSIADYNHWAQQLADASPYRIGADQGVVWKVIGSTDTVDARDNTRTNPEVDGVGCPIYLLDGKSLVARRNSDLWDGSISRIINLTEKGEVFTGWPWTGTYKDGTRAVDHDYSLNALGGSMLVGNVLEVNQGNSSSTSAWVWRYWTAASPDALQPMYALSEPITIRDSAPGVVAIRRRGTLFDIRWPSEAGKSYDLVSTSSADTPVTAWPVYLGYSNLAGSSTGYNQITGLSQNGPRRFFAIIER